MRNKKQKITYINITRTTFLVTKLKYFVTIKL